MVKNYIDFIFYIVCLVVIISIGACGIYYVWKDEMNNNAGRAFAIAMIVFGMSAFLYLTTDTYVMTHNICYMKDFINF